MAQSAKSAFPPVKDPSQAERFFTHGMVLTKQSGLRLNAGLNSKALFLARIARPIQKCRRHFETESHLWHGMESVMAKPL
jgi:hypothetical protein